MEGETDGLKHSPKKSILCKHGRFPLKARTNKGPATWFGVPALFRLHWERNSNPPSLSQTGWPDDARLTGHWAVLHPTSPAKQPSPNSIKLWATDLQKSITRAKFNHSVQVLLGTFTVSYTSVKILCTPNGWSILLMQEEASSPRGACSLSNSTSPREWHRYPWTKVFFAKGKQIWLARQLFPTPPPPHCPEDTCIGFTFQAGFWKEGGGRVKGLTVQTKSSPKNTEQQLWSWLHKLALWGCLYQQWGAARAEQNLHRTTYQLWNKPTRSHRPWASSTVYVPFSHFHTNAAAQASGVWKASGLHPREVFCIVPPLPATLQDFCFIHKSKGRTRNVTVQVSSWIHWPAVTWSLSKVKKTTGSLPALSVQSYLNLTLRKLRLQETTETDKAMQP